MGVYSTGNSYGVPEDLIYSFPVSIKVKLETFPRSVSDISFLISTPWPYLLRSILRSNSYSHLLIIV